MKRRNLVLGAAGAGGLGLLGAALWKPGDMGGPHSPYFAQLNQELKQRGAGRPTMVLDLARLNHNIDSLTLGIGPDKTYRVVVKSLPSLPLLTHIMHRAGTQALMVFHQPFLNEIAATYANADVLLGKPMPVNAVRTYYAKQTNPQFDSAKQVQWLVDTPERLQQYLALAKSLGTHMRVNLELDVGLHRGGFEQHESLDAVMRIMDENPAHLSLSGFMGYEPHLAGVTSELSHPAVRGVLDQYRGMTQF